jgi:hypothetical protein
MDMDTNSFPPSLVGKRIRLIVRQPNGTTSVYTGVLVSDEPSSYRIRTDRGEERIEPKLYAALEVL